MVRAVPVRGAIFHQGLLVRKAHAGVEYGEGYCGPWLPRAAKGRPVFEAVIPGHWSHDELKALLLTPPIMFSDGSPSYPTWEGGARYFGSEYLAWPKKAPKLAAGEPAH